jgi:hypothetical protein
VTAAILVQHWWQAGLAVIGIVLFNVIRHAIGRARHERAQTKALVAEWETYQRRRDQ